MQKKIIALAIAGLASTAAFAQSNVTIYGSIDAGYSYRFDPKVNYSNGAQAAKTADTRSGIDTGMSAGNRLGFKGVEDLGNGLKAVFLLEQGFNFDTGAQGQGGLMFGRQAYLGLAGNFGTVIAGRLYTPHFTMMATIDPFAAGTVGQYRNVWGANQANGSLTNLLDPVRVDNAVAYVSPNWGGFSVTGAFSAAAAPDGSLNGYTGAVASENAGNNARNNTVYVINPTYVAGPVYASFNAHYIDASSAVALADGVKDIQAYDLGGTYDFGVVKLAADVSYTKLESKFNDCPSMGYTSSGAHGSMTAGCSLNLTNYLLGATVPLGKGALLASAVYSQGNTQAGKNAAAYSVGYNYYFSKRTNFFSAYSLNDISGGRSAAGTVAGTADASVSGQSVVPATGLGSTSAVNPYTQAFQVGIRHQF